MSIIKKVMRNVKFLKNIYKEKSIIRSLLESGNLSFIKFAPPGHFYSPIPDLDEINSKSKNIFNNSSKYLPAIDINEDTQVKLLNNFSKLYQDMPFHDNKSEKWRYFLDNPYFSYGDGIVLYSFLRYFKPKRVIEIGSGFSSAEMLDLNDFFFKKEISFTFIEPFPDRLFSLISEDDKHNVKVEVKPVQDIDLKVFSSLKANDIIFIDSSHVAKINSDVLYIIFNIFPLLKGGVIIHFHDVLWPFEYPKNWLEEGRAWNEAYFLRAFLQHNSAFEILYFNAFMTIHHSNELREMMPAALKTPSSKITSGNSSLWLRKVN